MEEQGRRPHITQTAGKSRSCVMARWSICFFAVALTLVASASATPLTIEILNVSFSVDLTAVSGGGFDFLSQQSSTPLLDRSLFLPSQFNGSFAHANADYFEVSVDTAAHPGSSTAVAKSVIDFTTTTGTATLTLDFARGGVTQFTAGSLILEDLTASQLLWQYGWSSGFNSLTYPFNAPNGPNLATLVVNQAFVGGDTYRLTMRASSGASADTETASIRVSNVTIPETSSLLLLSVGVWGLFLLCRHSST